MVRDLLIFLILAQAAQLPRSPVAQAASPPQLDKKDDQRFYYHLDHLGNTNVVTDDRGAEFERREYRPFGEQSTRTGSRSLEISFNGHQFDGATGFYYFGARHYDPVLGRFLTADTQVADRSPQALHRYEFNKNNPLRFVDKTGHDFFDVLADIGVGILVAVGIAAGILLIVVTGGGATPLVALAIGAAAGALIGASIAFGIGFILYRTGAISFGDVLSITLAGAIIGAAIGATIGIGIAGSFAAGASNATVIASDTALGAATGSVGSATGALVHGASPDQFLEAVYKGAASGALSGATFRRHIGLWTGAVELGELPEVARRSERPAAGSAGSSSSASTTSRRDTSPRSIGWGRRFGSPRPCGWARTSSSVSRSPPGSPWSATGRTSTSISSF